MAMFSLKVSIQEHGITKTIQFDRSMKTRDACKVIRDKMQEVPLGPEKDYGLFLSDEDQKKGVWLEMDNTLEHYLLRSGDLLVYKRKMRTLRVRMLDGSVKTVLVDDAQPVAKLMVVICTKIGITNHDEYSLVREMPEENKEPSYGTLTLRRDKNKMEQLKKKIKTDDDLNWVDHSKTLREQGIDEEENLLLRRKYFFSDHNVDSRDPIQLNLLYVQARDAILNGAHPVTVEQALQFGGIQCQIQFGDYNENKHKPGLLDLKEFLPKDFYKNKGIAKKVFVEHKKFSGLSEIDAKVQYVALARSLKTYGVTFFLVKEQRKNKNKLVPRLLGVTKESVLRLDEKTKEILETWPLTRVRKWAASPNSFTLDFGDYSDSYYSVQTTEGEQISQLIAGYIDIIIKKQRSNDHMGIEGDEGSTMVEDNVTPAKATILQQNPGARLSQISTGSIALPAVMRVGANGAQTPGLGQVQPVKFGDVKNQAHSVYAPVSPQHSRVHSAELTEPQRAYLSMIDSGHEAVEEAQKELASKAELGKENSLQWKQNTLDVKRQTVSSQIAAMNAATAQVISYTSVPPEEVDHPAVGAAISTIATNLPEMSKDVKVMAALMEDASGDRLLEAARGLCSAFSELLRAAEPEEPRQVLLTAAGRVGEASHAVLYTIGEEPEGEQEVVMGLAKAVANATASLVLRAKAVATRCVEQPVASSAVVHSATQCALATSQLMACSKVIAPIITNAAGRHQLLEAAQEVAHAVQGVVAACHDSGVPDETQEVRGAADHVNTTLQGLQEHVAALATPVDSPQEDAVEKILSTSGHLATASMDSGEMIRQARFLAKVTSDLIMSLKGEADQAGDGEIKNRIMSAARILADATTRLLEAAKGCSNNPKDEEYQLALHRAAEEVRQATSGAASVTFKRKLIRKLENAAKEACAAASQTIAAAKGASSHNTSEATDDELLESCKEVAAMIPKVIKGVKAVLANVDSSPAQVALIKYSLALVEPCQKMVAASRSALSTINSAPHRLHLANACTNMEERLAALQEVLERVQGVCGALELERALEAIQHISEELKKWKDQMEKGELKPLDGETPESTAALMGASTRSVGAAMSQLLTAANQGQESTTGVAARDTARHLKGLAHACRAVAAAGKETDPLDCAQEAMLRSKDLVSVAQEALEQQLEDPARLSSVARSVSMALSDCRSCLPALRQLDQALSSVAQSSQQLATSQFPASSKPYPVLQANLNSAAAELNTSAARLVDDAPTNRLATTAQDFERSYGNLMDCGLEMAGSTASPEVQSQVVVILRNVSIASSKLLSVAKLTASDPMAPSNRNQLVAAARSVTDAINKLVDVCTCTAPGQKECDNAIRKIQSMRPLLDNLSEPVRDASYFECLDSVIEQSKVLGEAITSIASPHVKPELLAHGVKTMAFAICELIEAGVQAGYLIGIAEPGSVPGRPGIMDLAQLYKAGHAVKEACQQLADDKDSQIINTANAIAKHTSFLCSTSKLASNKATDSVTKAQIALPIKEVAATTANLVQAIKVLDQDPSDRNRGKIKEAIEPLFVAIDKFLAYASSAQFATIPAKLSEKARYEQQPIVDSGLDIIEGSCNMIGAAKSLVVEPKEPLSRKALSENSKKVSDAIIAMVAAIKDHSPGQKECDAAVKKLGQAMQLLSQGPCVNGGPPPCFDKSIQDRIKAISAEILKLNEAICKAAKSEPQGLATSVKSLSEQAEPLARAAVLASDPGAQQLPDLVRLVLESAMQLVVVAKETGGNPRSSHLHGELDQAAVATKASVLELLSSLAKMDTSARHMDALSQALSKVELQPASPRAEQSFSDFDAAMASAAKEIAKISQEMASKAGSSPSELEPLAQQLCIQFSQLASWVPGCVATCSSPELGSKITHSVKELGGACHGMVQTMASHQSSPTLYTQQALQDASRAVAERVSQVLSVLNAGSRGLQACDNAASTVSGIIGDLDTTILFATAGTLHPDSDQELFSDHREAILKTAQALMADTQLLVTGAHSGQEQLAVAAQSAVSTIVQLTEVVKLGAASLGTNNTQSQVLLINAVKDVASTLGDLIHATKLASQHGPGSTAAALLTEQARALVNITTSLLKTVKVVEDEHTRGTRALESTIEAINQEIRAYTTQRGGAGKMATPEELVRVTKPVTLATARTVAAGTSCKQDDAIVAANMSRRALTDLLLTCKAASQATEELLRNKILEAGRSCALTYHELLMQTLQMLQKPSSLEGKQRLANYSRSIAQTLAEIVSLAQAMKGSDYVDPDDPTVIAESELIFAANSIDAAARKLESFKPRQSLKTTTAADESQNFDKMILDAAKAIAVATSALVRAATVAQRDLVQAGKVGVTASKCWSDDGQWSEGLVSAAKLVTGATNSLVEAANQLVQGEGGSRERLVSAARQVAASTAQLLVACQVRAHPNSVSMKRLQAAGNGVKKATDNLVQSAQRVLEDEVAPEHVQVSSGMVGGIAQEIVAREAILRKERELQEARNKLEALRKAKYHHEESRTNV